MKTHSIANRFLRPAVLVAGASMLMPTLVGCGNSTPPPPREATPAEMSRAGQPTQPQVKTGMSTGKKVAILAGAALLYYMYKKKQAADNTPKNVQYYVSKSTGRIYYRDPKTHQAIWMTPPPSQVRPMEVTQDEYGQYKEIPTLQGYNNSQSGYGLDKYLNVQ